MLKNIHCAAIAILFAIALSPTPSNADIFDLSLQTPERNFAITLHRTVNSKNSAAVVIMGGAKGYKSNAYQVFSSKLNEAGIDVFLVHYVSAADEGRMKKASSARERKIFYKGRLGDWVASIQETIVSSNISGRSYRKFGVIGISLGAMPALSYSANNSRLDALVVIDGNFLENSKPTLKKLPPLLMIWGEKDRVFSLASGLSLRDQARSLGGRAELRSFPGEDHAFFLDSKRPSSRAAMDVVVNFLKSELAN